MARLFWVVCPKCEKRFYAATDDFRHKDDRPLLCPFCGARFPDRDAREVIETR